jgi:molybdopterin-containing oxidoreductase family iron-sulfur binding subunit
MPPGGTVDDDDSGDVFWQRLTSLVPAERELGRRELMKLLGASLALAGAPACARGPLETMRPYVAEPRESRPGRPLHYATTMTLEGFGTGLVVESHDGRPTKIEGNPEHPASRGAAGVFEQASILGLYDPHRAQAVRRRDGKATAADVLAALARPRPDAGAGLRVLLEPTGSPLAASLVARVLARHPRARFTFHSATSTGAAEEGAALAFGQRLQPQLDLGAADVVVAVDADVLGAGPMHLAHARAFADRRRVDHPGATMSRLYCIEPMPTPTGMAADHRIRRRACDALGTLAAIVAELSPLVGTRPGWASELTHALAPLSAHEDRKLAGAIARDLVRAGPAALLVVGDRQPPEAHALAHLAHAALGARTTTAITPTRIDAGPATQSLAALADELRAGAVDTLVVLEVNACYLAPADLDFPRLFAAVPSTIYLGLYEDETGRAAATFVPAAHYLEAWGDAVAYDGTYSLAQPLIAPIYEGHTALELLAALGGDAHPNGRLLVREAFRSRYGGDDRAFDDALRRGLVPGSAASPATPKLAPRVAIKALHQRAATLPDPTAFELGFAPDPSVHDGRFADNAWLMELPKPLTKQTWGNAALVSPGTAAELGLVNGDLVELSSGGRVLVAPALLVSGHADRSVTLHLGYGRDGAETLARGVGVDAGKLRTTAAPLMAVGVTLRRTGRHEAVAATMWHHSTQGRPVALSTTLAAFAANPGFTAELKSPPPSLLAPKALEGDQWAMTIDLGACTGCGACVVACQAENNVPVVGKDEVIRGREMHWLRIDSYENGGGASPEIVNQPMACQHCERAPCEYVCPVGATVHSPDGLNEMVYNRCVGTRFCSNNCPYKVRRFNYYDWLAHEPANQGTVQLQRNPDVTVRERGVMEKCTYCVQRIREAEIGAREAGRALRDGDVRTACQQACPSKAIAFGSLTHPGAEVAAWRARPQSYAVLHDQGTEPRTRYLARIRNPNPEIG